MSLRRQLAHGLYALTNPTAADRDVDDELRHYVELSGHERVRSGAAPSTARRDAMLEMGNLTVAREELRSQGWEHLLSTLFGDLHYGLRRLRRDPGFAITTVLTLALGIGASTAIFSAVKPVLLDSLPYPESSRIVMISDVAEDGQPLQVAFGSYLEIVRRSHSFASIAPLNSWHPALIADAAPERLIGERVGADYFRALGRAPLLGRDFQQSDDRPHGPHVVILSSALWQRRFQADPDIIGKSIRLGNDQYLVLGIMPRDFENVLAPLAELWTPLQFEEVFGPQSREWGHQLRVVARLRPGANIDGARAELSQIARAPVAEFSRVPWAALDKGLVVSSLQADVTRNIRPVILAVAVGVILLLAIVCVNVTNLLLARGAQRRAEFAMRAALGAQRTRLARQLITESVALALLGGMAGMFVAELGVLGIVALDPPGLPRISAIHLDRTVFAFGFLITTMIGVVVGVLPALRATSRERGATSAGTSRIVGGNRRTRGVLVVTEVALALVLLVSAGLLFRSIARVFAVRVGFDASQLLTMQLQETGPQFQDDSTRVAQVDSARYRFYSDALESVRQLPRVRGATITSLLPLTGENDTYGVHFESDAEAKSDGAALRYAVTPEYFGVMNIPLVQGRLLDARDGAGAPRVVVINKTFARRRFADQNPLGRRLRFGPEEGEWYSIVGVVGDVKQSALDGDQPDQIYLTPPQWHWVDGSMALVVRARGSASALTPAIRDAIWSVDRDIPISRVATMEDIVDRSVSDRHFALILFEVFGLSALLLAAIGIYGILSGSVTERTREIGVRAALGASTRSIVGMVLRIGMTLSAAGIVVGLVGAAAASRVVGSMLFGVSRLDPATYLGVVLILGAVSAVACALPALRAARVDPASTLKVM